MTIPNYYLSTDTKVQIRQRKDSLECHRWVYESEDYMQIKCNKANNISFLVFMNAFYESPMLYHSHCHSKLTILWSLMEAYNSPQWCRSTHLTGPKMPLIFSYLSCFHLAILRGNMVLHYVNHCPCDAYQNYMLLWNTISNSACSMRLSVTMLTWNNLSPLKYMLLVSHTSLYCLA